MKIKTGLIFVVFLSLISFAGCTNPQNDSENESEALVLKSYKVPERMAKEVRGTINDLLSREAYNNENSKPPIGKATIAPDGQILVAAPKSFHDGLKDFIASLANSKPEPSLTIEVNYWVVAGRKANKPATFEDFKTIKPALETIQNNQGSMEFKLLDHVVTTSSGQGTRSQVKGSLSQITQYLTADNKGTLVIQTDINMNTSDRFDMKNNINTQIEIKNGELVVLGQVSQEFKGISIFNPIKDEEEKITKVPSGRTYVDNRHVEMVNVYYIISAAVKK